MRTTNNTRKSKFLAFLLSVMMVSSAGAIFASCTDGDGDSSSVSSSTSEETEETKKDTGEIKNASFDFTTTSKTTVIGTSVTGWSRSVYSTSSGSASSSKSASGVISTSKDDWDYMTVAYYTEDQLKEMSDAEAKEKWDTFGVKDKLAYYDIWKAREANKDKTISKDFAPYESINIDEEDIPTVGNPGTYSEDAEDDNVLMIHNHYYVSSSKKDQLVGTAQKYTSSSTVTIPAGKAKKVSVWVKTDDLKSIASDGTTQDAIGKGAYISVNHSVGGKSLDAYEVKNINTEGEWKEYTFYIKGSYYADTTFSLVLGLGQGSTTDRLEYVNGYAFFDNITVSDVEDFETETAGLKYATLEDEKAAKTIDAYEKDGDKFAMNFYGDAEDWLDETDVNGPKFNTTEFKATASTDGSSVNPTAAATDVTAVFDGQEAIATTIATDTAKYEYLDYVYSNFFEGDEFVASNDILMLLSTNGTAYTAENAMSFTLPADQNYMAISFFVKTSNLNGGTGAGITLVNGLNKTAFSAIDTSALAEDEDNTTDGWQQVFFFVERDEDASSKAIPFTLNFNYGPTDITSAATKASFAQGFAAFAKFTAYSDMTDLEYEAAATGTYAKKVVLKETEEDKAAGNSGFDTAVGVPSNALEKGLANPQNYKGVYSDNYRVKLPETADDLKNADEKRAYNNYAGQAGLLNREYFAKYTTENWETHFGDATQPLVIVNDTNATKPYGFISTAKSTSDEYTAISLRVKTVDAVASIYLVDMDDETRQSMLSVSRGLTYWYDDEGNICTGDPSKNSTTIAFKLQKNGLYKASQNWDGNLGEWKDEYFANLSAYTERDGILYANENSASHDYYDYTWNREMFYKHTDGYYYTEANGAGVKVIDLKDITKDVTGAKKSVLTARYLPEAKQELKIEEIETNGEWAYVTFYIHKGASAKNYRLEVWSGKRDGTIVNKTAGGYVAFDTNNPGTAADNFALAEEYKDHEEVNSFDGVFSYFDTDKHVRYNAELDEKKIGNLYAESYVPSSFSESLAYLAYLNYDNDNIYNVFADYSVSDQTVAAQEQTDDDTTDSSSDEEESESELNVWLLASSIAVAGVLVLAVASIIVRKILVKYKKKHGMKARKVVKEKKAPKAKKVEKTVDEDSPYND